MNTEIRLWRREDLPKLREFAVTNAMELLSPDDRAHTTPEIVKMAAEHNVTGILSMPGGTAFVADYQGRPVGYCLVSIQQDEKTGESSGYLADCYIEPAFRRTGIAPAFHKVAQAYLNQLGIRKSRLWVHAHNGTSYKSVQRAGFTVKGVMMAKELPRG